MLARSSEECPSFQAQRPGESGTRVRQGWARSCEERQLAALAGTIASCLLLRLGLYIKAAAVVAVIVFVSALTCLLTASIYYGCEVRVALSSVQKEARDLRFMDLGTHTEHKHRDTM
jgi:hypothetical protein